MVVRPLQRRRGVNQPRDATCLMQQRRPSLQQPSQPSPFFLCLNFSCGTFNATATAAGGCGLCGRSASAS